MRTYETIAALSTPPGKGGIAVIRISGPEAITIADSAFRSKSVKSLDEAEARYAIYGDALDADGNKADSVLLTVFRAPFSFTGEDVVEISCHGGSAVVNMILDSLVSRGARIAEGGEFSKRAFINGKLDLSQAEAIMDLIESETEYNVISAGNQLAGRLSSKTEEIRAELIDINSNILAVIDYPDEEIDDLTVGQIIEKLTGISEKLSLLLKTYDTGKILREGADIVIAGKPNVGKSSIMNAFLKEDRAIVTDMAGTTRDILEEYVDLGGIKARLTDTAGIRAGGDKVEIIGVTRAKERVANADIVLFTVDKAAGVSDEDKEILSFIRNKTVVGIINKSDLGGTTEEETLKKLYPFDAVFEISALTGEGIGALCEYIKSKIFNGEVNIRDNLYITNKRHFESLTAALGHVKKAANSLNEGMFADIVTIDIENAVSSLGEVSGKTVSEEIVNNIFSKFCVGK